MPRPACFLLCRWARTRRGPRPVGCWLGPPRRSGPRHSETKEDIPYLGQWLPACTSRAIYTRRNGIITHMGMGTTQNTMIIYVPIHRHTHVYICYIYMAVTITVIRLSDRTIYMRLVSLAKIREEFRGGLLVPPKFLPSNQNSTFSIGT